MVSKVTEKRHLWWIASYQHCLILDGECEYVDYGGSNRFGQWFTPWSNHSRTGLTIGGNAFETQAEALDALIKFHETQRTDINRKLRALRKQVKSISQER